MSTKLSTPIFWTRSLWHEYSSAKEWIRVPNSFDFFSSVGSRELNRYFLGQA